MKRIVGTSRPNWKTSFEEIGFSFHSLDGEYWKEGVWYEFTDLQIDYLDEVTMELNEMCLNLVDNVVKNGTYSKLGIPFGAERLIKESWEKADPSLYGRMDFAYDGTSQAKFLEYNADTPTSLYEAAVAQWLWLNETNPKADQFNSIHETLISTFKGLADRICGPLHFTCISDSEEDLVTTEYLRDTCTQAGIDARFIFIEDVGYSDATGFVGVYNDPIKNLFKLYPWEWMLQEDFGSALMNRPFNLILEPAWKLILTSKGILPLLWEMYPNHPNLLPASWTPMTNTKYVKKPFFSREGANISIFDGKKLVQETGGYFGYEGFVYQQYHELPKFDDQYTLVGSWIIGDKTAGMGIREDSTPITRNTSKFVPHLFR